MRTRSLGKTGVAVSELGLGTCFMALQGQQGVNECVARAVDRGISYFDTAADYGDDESMLGEALRGRRDGVFLATKVGGVEAPDGHRRASSLMRQFERGLSRLQTDRVDLIQLHEAEQRKWWSDDPVTEQIAKTHSGPLIQDEEDYDFADSPCLTFLKQAREQGKARFIGITGKDARRLTRLVEALEIDSMMVAHQYNAILRSAPRYLLPLTESKGVGVAGGAMFIKGWLAVARTEWRDQPPDWMNDEFHRAYFGYLDVQASSGIPLPELTLRWLLAEERIHCIVTGFKEWREIESNIEAIERGRLPGELRSAIDALGIVQPLYYQGRSEM